MNDNGLQPVPNIGVYVRESRDENSEDIETIETQRDLLLDYINRERLGNPARIYVDDNISGSEFERQGIRLLREDVLSRKIDLLLLKDLSRLGRNNAKTLLFLDFLEENGVRVQTYDKRYDSSRDNDTVGIETWYNERYVRDISRKIRANLRYKIQKGDYLGHAPFGYKKSEDVRNRLVIDEQEAEAVRTIYKAYLYGLGYSGIARLMESKGISPPKERWNPATIQRILTSRVYLGDTVQGVSERISFKSKKARRLPSARWVLTENTHEAIISREDYEEVQRLRSGKSLRAGSHKGSISLFNGVVYCGGCGSRLNARVRRGVRGYICGNYGRNGLKGCTSHYISEEDLKKLVSDEIRVLLADQELIEKVGRMLGKELLPQGTPEERSEKLKTQLTGKLRQQEVLYRDRLEGRITLELFERMNASLEDKIGFLKEEISGLQVTDSRGEVKGIMEEAVDWLRSGGLSHGIIIAMVNRITVYSKGDEGFATLLEEVPDAAAAKTLAVVEFRF